MRVILLLRPGGAATYPDFPMLPLSRIRWLLLSSTLLSVFAPLHALGQDDPNDVPLGDVARNLRKQAPTRPVIDDDNLIQAMQQAEGRKGFGASLRYLMAGDGLGFRLSAPDVTCNLSFNRNAKSLLSSQYSEMQLPASDVEKLEGRAAIEADALNVSVHNRTDWHVSEIAVAFTVVRKKAAGDLANWNSKLEVEDEASSAAELRADRKPDTTVIYRMRAVGVPWSATTFSSRLDQEIASEDEWHWAIVEARGYPPESYRRSTSSDTADERNSNPADNAAQASEPIPPPKRVEVTPVSNRDSGSGQLVPSSNSQ